MNEPVPVRHPREGGDPLCLVDSHLRRNDGVQALLPVRRPANQEKLELVIMQNLLSCQ